MSLLFVTLARYHSKMKPESKRGETKGKKNNVRSLPRVVDPDISNRLGGEVAAAEDFLGQDALLALVLVVEDKDGKGRLLTLAAALLDGRLDVLFQLADGVLEGCARVVDLVDNEDVLANQVGHFQRRQVEPLGARDLCAGLLDLCVVARAQLLVQREANGLDGDVGRVVLFEKRTQDARRHVAAAANGDHEVGLEFIENLLGGLLAVLVDL
jgi:hypothetical protein